MAFNVNSKSTPRVTLDLQEADTTGAEEPSSLPIVWLDCSLGTQDGHATRGPIASRHACLRARPSTHMHVTPTYSSWLNQVELWFAKIERDVIARGVFTSGA